jgi:hypothetical protein
MVPVSTRVNWKTNHLHHSSVQPLTRRLFNNHHQGKVTPILHTGKHGLNNFITILQNPQGHSAIVHSTIATTNKLLKEPA